MIDTAKKHRQKNEEGKEKHRRLDRGRVYYSSYKARLRVLDGYWYGCSGVALMSLGFTCSQNITRPIRCLKTAVATDSALLAAS
jgi:hypothetical protein